MTNVPQLESVADIFLRLRQQRKGLRFKEKTMTTIRNLSIDEVAVLIGVHPKSLFRSLREGDFPNFPKPRLLPNGRKRWILADIEQWILSQPESE